MMFPLGNVHEQCQGSQIQKQLGMPKKLHFPDCGTKSQVVTQRVEAALSVDTCIHLTVAAQTTHHPVSVHPCQHPHQQHQQQQQHLLNLATPAPETTNTKWAKNLSNKPLTEVKISLLARGSIFCVVPLYSQK